VTTLSTAFRWSKAMAAIEELKAGTMIAGRTVGKILGAGISGTVYLLDEGKEVLKLYNWNPQDGLTGDILMDFQLLRGYLHPHILHATEMLLTPTQVGLIMPSMEATSLIFRRHPTTPSHMVDRAYALYHLAGALHFLHQHYLLHLDIKSENFLYNQG